MFDGLYEAAALPAFWPSALDALARRLNARGALVTRPDHQHRGIAYSPSLSGTVALFFEGGWNTRDLRTSAVVRRGSGRVSTDRDVAPFDDLVTGEYYRGFAKPAGVPWFATVGLIEPGGAQLGLSLQRSDHEGMFSNTEVEAIETLMPRLKHVLSVSRRLERRRESEFLSGAGAFGEAAILLDASGREIDANAEAEALIGHDLLRHGRRLVAADPRAREPLQRLIDSACNGEYPAAWQKVVLPSRTGSLLVARAAPVTGAARDLFGDAAVVLVFSVEPGVREPPSEVTLAAAFDLTPGEARVAALVARGLSPRAVADKLGVSYSTVRFHLKAIMPKADVRRQAEFVAKVASLGGGKASDA